jgi:transposase
LRPEDLRRIERGLKRGPQALGYETSLWTSWRVAHLIEHECRVKYHPSQAWRILRQLGWSCQRPVGRALERDEDKIRRWKQECWPEIKKKPKKKAAPSSSSTKAD